MGMDLGKGSVGANNTTLQSSLSGNKGAPGQSLADKLGMPSAATAASGSDAPLGGGSGSNPLFNTLFRDGKGSSDLMGGAALLGNGANLKSGQISSGFVPLSATPLGAGTSMGGLQTADPASASTGELIMGTYHTYYGPVAGMIPPLSQDLDKSLDTLSDLNVSRTKKFRNKADPKQTVLIFLAQNAKNISLVINQEELCDNVVSHAVMEQLGFGKKKEIADTTAASSVI